MLSSSVVARSSRLSGAKRQVRGAQAHFNTDNAVFAKNLEEIRERIKAAGLANDSFNVDTLNELQAKDPQLRSLMEKNRQVIASMLPLKAPVRVTVTGASGQIGYSLLFRLARGDMLGPRQPIILHLLELTPALKALEGVAMELQDCAFPLLHGVVQTDDANKAFEGADYALLVGAKPRSKGMERADLLKENAKIFENQGRAINDYANSWVKVAVVGNPANTNAMITSHYAPKIAPTQITAMTRLDHNRGLGMLAEKTGVNVSEITNFCIWGNHSATQYPDINHTLIRGKPAKDLVSQDWVHKTFIPAVQQRGAAIINARGASSAASAASAAIDHVHDWVMGTQGEWTSMAVPSDGAYGVDKGLWYSFPVVCSGGGYKIVGNVPVDKTSADLMEKTRLELVQERDSVGLKTKAKK